MDYKKLNVDKWKSLSKTGNLISGYQTIWLAPKDNEESDLHIFIDDSDYYHFSIQVSDIKFSSIEDPHVNGLQIKLNSYKFNTGKVNQFIDIICTYSSYLEEFTEIIKEITEAIIDKGDLPLIAVNRIIKNWVSFWSKQRREILTEEEQIGLICELLILQKLCQINPSLSLKSWTGPLGEKYDFNFTNLAIEVKGTRSSKRIHIINGLDQLSTPRDKQLAFISFLLISSDNPASINLPFLIESLKDMYFNNKPELTIKFYELISNAGYNPIYSEEYKKFNVEILESTVYEVNSEFPRLTSDMLIEPLSPRVSSVKYNLSLEGLKGIDIQNLDWNDYLI
jgi:hypothetical protein